MSIDISPPRKELAQPPSSPEPLAELLIELGSCPPDEAAQLTASGAQTMLGAGFAILVYDGVELASSGVCPTPGSAADLGEAAQRADVQPSLAGIGTVNVAAAALSGELAGWLVVGRPEPFTEVERTLLKGISQAIGLRLGAAGPPETGSAPSPLNRPEMLSNPHAGPALLLGPDRPGPAMESDLRAGLERKELRLLYQPVMGVADRSLVAVEALLRWQHPTRGLLGPHEFIALAEESELIISVGSWVIEEACAQLRRWCDEHPAELGVRVSVNVSARQLSPALVATVARALVRSRVEPSSLALEITESLLIEHTECSREVLAALKALGVAIVLDDFGTGYSSLGYLNEFPLAQLKLDRSFTAELARDPRSAKIVAATIDMARAMGMTVVAEGVEDEDQLEVLRRLGCDYAQGFLFARPEPAEKTFARIQAAYEHDRQLSATPDLTDRHASAPSLSGVGPEDPHQRQQLAIGRLAGWLFLAGSTLSLPSNLIFGFPGLRVAAILTMIGALTGLACLAVPWQRMSEGWLSVATLLATVEITLSVLAVGSHGAVLQPIYLLVATAAAYAFRDRRVLAAHVALIAAAMTIPALRSDATAGRVALTSISILVLVAMTAAIAYLRELLEGSAAELRDLAGRDPLTDVGNYRLLHERLDYEVIRHHRDHQRLAVLLIDLDRFKQVNERRGHAAGDDVLRRVALALRATVRQQDTVARQGGDEFAVLAPATDVEGAAMLAERIREQLGRVKCAGDSVGATIGWAVYPMDGQTGEELMARADEELMASKLHPQRAVTGSLGQTTLAGVAEALSRLELLGGSDGI